MQTRGLQIMKIIEHHFSRKKNARDVRLIKIEDAIAIRVLRIIVLQMDTQKSLICKFCCVNILNWEEWTHTQKKADKLKVKIILFHYPFPR